MPESDNKFGVLLFDAGWKELGEALKPYEQNGPIGKYLYCRNFEVNGPFVELTFSPGQVEGRIKEEMTIWIPTGFIKFVTTASAANEKAIGFL